MTPPPLLLQEKLARWLQILPAVPAGAVRPDTSRQLLVHSCCAPCTGPMIESLQNSGIRFTLFFYNPNIHPRKEYLAPKASIAAYARKRNIPFIDGGYDPRRWFKRIKGFENAPERGQRGSKCFDIRLELTALFAHAHDFPVFTSSCGISRFKNIDQVNACGLKAAGRYPHLTYWTRNWRKQGGAQAVYGIARRERFYKQRYCGCVYFYIKARQKRKQNNLPPIRFGQNFYTARRT